MDYADDWDWGMAERICLREARRMLRDPYEVEEAVQEALMRAWRRRDSCRDRGSPGPWLRQIARNECLRLIERRGLRRTVELTPEAHEAEPVGRQAVEAVADRLDVRDALGRLSADERRLVALRYLMELGQPDIARRLGIPEATVRVRLHRIRKRLRGDLTADAA
jgi:RNA polymerase sigma-70 factor (ECF subfamily)